MAFDSEYDRALHMTNNPQQREVCRVICQPSKPGQVFRLVAEYPTKQDAENAARAAALTELQASRTYRRHMQNSPAAAGRRLDKLRAWLAAEKAKEQPREIPGL